MVTFYEFAKEYLKKASLENILMKKFYDVNFNDPTGK